MDSIVWSLTNLITSLILPPGLFFVLIGVGLWLGREPRKLNERAGWPLVGRWLAVVSLILFISLSLNVVGYGLAKPFEDDWPPLDPAVAARLPADQAVIVVLGGGKILGAIEYADRETLARASLRRSVYAAQLSERTGLRLAVAGGKPAGGALGEAVLMKDFIEKSLKRSVAFVEDQSFDTRQNAINMAKTLAQRKIRTVVLVTDVLHMPRAVNAFRAAGLTVVPAPMHFQASAPLNITDFLPSVSGLEISRYALHELIGEVWYRVRRSLPFQ